MLKLCVPEFALTYKNVGMNDGVFAWFCWEHRAIALASGEAGNAAVATLGLKNRSHSASGWHTAQRLEHSGREGGVIQQQVVRRLDVSTLNEEQLEALECALLASMGSGNGRE